MLLCINYSRWDIFTWTFDDLNGLTSFLDLAWLVASSLSPHQPSVRPLVTVMLYNTISKFFCQLSSPSMDRTGSLVDANVRLLPFTAF